MERNNYHQPSMCANCHYYCHYLEEDYREGEARKFRCPWCKSPFSDEKRLKTEQDGFLIALRSEDGLEGFEILTTHEKVSLKVS